MDAQAKQKALFRAKLNAQKREKQRIDSPLVRYNEHDQPVCRVCDVVVKSELHWPAHQASRKHHEAIEKFKASAAAQNRANDAKSESAKELPKPKPVLSRDLSAKSEPSVALPKQQSSTLPPDFFDDHSTKRQKNEREPRNFGTPDSVEDSVSAKNQLAEASVSGNGISTSSTATTKQMGQPGLQASKDFRQVSKSATGLESKQAKGALPEGFFDDKDAELRARGITPVKPDVKDEYKEFERLIKDDLQEIDNRLEEEEFDAAETIEEEEMVEQRNYVDRVEMLRRKKLELKASRSAVAAKSMEVTHKDSCYGDSSSDDEDNENFKVDWRAKHL
ncbi:protein ABA AND ROS SENSITIVE 1 [Salvia miltiorrhiza]|uniref:protein ABA AND ROS SENSITIVE 1 n=1 Tax=Salvia miltiorrhiza TaxID=226208 RepID=UPI0025ABB387|nr:protein ABA AND ROS SENSITIVE 1 [Salvia miltiorrhiza]